MKIIVSLFATLLISQTVHAQSVSLRPTAEGGLSISRFLDLDEADQAIKASAGKIYGYHLYNAGAAARYFKFYDALAANVTVGTTTPVITISVPAGGVTQVEFSMGIAFVTGITAACVTGLADNSAGAPGANECIANVFFK